MSTSIATAYISLRADSTKLQGDIRAIGQSGGQAARRMSSSWVSELGTISRAASRVSSALGAVSIPLAAGLGKSLQTYMKQGTVSAMDFRKEWDASDRILANAVGRIGEMVSKSKIMGRTITEWKTSLSAFLGRLTPEGVQALVSWTTALVALTAAMKAFAIVGAAIKGMGAVAGLLGLGGAAAAVGGAIPPVAAAAGARAQMARNAAAGGVAGGVAAGVAAEALVMGEMAAWAIALGPTVAAISRNPGFSDLGWAARRGKMAVPSDEDMEGGKGGLNDWSALAHPVTMWKDLMTYYSLAGRTLEQQMAALDITVQRGMGRPGARWNRDAQGNMSSNPQDWLASQRDVLSAVKSTMGTVAFGKATREAVAKQLAEIDDAIANGVDNFRTKSEIEALVSRRPQVVSKLSNSLLDGLQEVQKTIGDELKLRSKGSGSMSKERLNQLFSQMGGLEDDLLKLGGPASGLAEGSRKKGVKLSEKWNSMFGQGGVESPLFQFHKQYALDTGSIFGETIKDLSPKAQDDAAAVYAKYMVEQDRRADRGGKTALIASEGNEVRRQKDKAFTEDKFKLEQAYDWRVLDIKQSFYRKLEDIDQAKADRDMERSLERVGGGGQIVSAEGVWGAAQSFEHAWQEKLVQTAAEQRADLREMRDLQTSLNRESQDLNKNWDRDIGEIKRLFKQWDSQAVQ